MNTRPGTSALEQRELAPMAAQARAAGFHTIFMAPGRYNHLHVDSYKTGTPYVPKDGLAYLHQGERVVPKAQNRSREFSGGSGGGVSFSDVERIIRSLGARSTSIAVTAPPNEAGLVRKLVSAQRDLKFLHG